MGHRVNTFGFLVLWCWCLARDLRVQAQIRLPLQLFIGTNKTTAIRSSTCNSLTEFYDEAALACSQCTMANGASIVSTPSLVPDKKESGLARACTCNNASIWKSETESKCELVWPVPCSSEICVPCPLDQVPSLDASRCMSCGNSTLGIQETIRECKCAINSVLKEKSENGSLLEAKECVACAANTIADSLTNTCKACPDPAMTATDDELICTCPSDHQNVASLFMGVQKCILKTHVELISSRITLSTAKTMTFSSFVKDEADVPETLVVSLSSAVLDDMFLSAAIGCYFYQSERDIRSCQALGNLCVLQHFDLTTPSCTIFDLIQRSGRSATVNNINGWFAASPFLNYWAAAPKVVQTPIAMKMSFDASIANSFDHLDFILASYHINGTLIGFQSLTNELEYCQSINVAAPPSWLRFGVITFSKYSCNLKTLPTSTLMHELFLIDQSKNDEDEKYIPIPVLNVNYRDGNGLYVNRDSDTSNDFLTHRFFLYDNQMGVPIGESSAKVIRYAESITLTIKTQASDSHFFYVPQLRVTYIDTQKPRSVPISFRVTYTSNTATLYSYAKSLFIVGYVLAGCRVLLQTFNWYRRSIRHDVVNNVMGQVLSTMACSSASLFAPVSFGVMIIMCSYVFAILRLQSSTIIMLPEVKEGIDEYYPFRVLLPLSFFCQLASVVHHIYRQSQLQLFFIDWEKPRATVMDIDSAKPTYASISVWRMILVVNEWDKLQTVRKTSLRFTLVLVLFLLYGCNLKLLALPVPRAQMEYVTLTTSAASSDATDHRLNPYLRFVNVSIWWLISCMGQRLWKWTIFERYIDEPRDQLFIDLCTVSKISCFILDDTYHGFYLHCRSPHQFADGNMKELVNQLKQEEAGLTGGRHLDASFPECQTFEIFVTRKWKRKFGALYSSVRGENTADGRGEGVIQRSFSPKGSATLRLKSTDSKRPHGHVATEAMVHNAEQLRNFLQAFVENQSDRYRWRIYRAHTCLTRFLDVPPDMSFSKQSLFLPDTASRFAKASLLLGIENELMLLDLLCFCLLDLWGGNHAVSALVTYVLQLVLLSARAHMGRRNIAKSTLVDSRFLI